jgi:hypothetical protein
MFSIYNSNSLSLRTAMFIQNHEVENVRNDEHNTLILNRLEKLALFYLTIVGRCKFCGGEDHFSDGCRTQ